MPHMVVRPHKSDDLKAMAELLAATIRQNKATYPELSKKFEGVDECCMLLTDRAALPHVRTAVALQNGRLVGFLLGQEQLTDPADPRTYFAPAYSVGIQIYDHAVAADADATHTYRALYAELAQQWVSSGFQQHAVDVFASDIRAQEAWNGLSFGRKLQYAIRDTQPVQLARPETVEVRQVSSDQLEDVCRFSQEMLNFHRQPPIFWPAPSTLEDGFRKMHAEFLADPENAYFLAYDGADPTGMFFFVSPGFLPQVVVPPHTTYLFMAVVTQAERSQGIGSTLLRHSMDWARSEGYDCCALHFHSANPRGAPFWLHNGFHPICHSLTRMIDPRITWS